MGTIAVRHPLNPSRHGRREVLFAMVCPNSVRQRFILPRLFMVYASKTTTDDTADWEL